MKFGDILKRITGISCPMFGVQWNPAKSERDIASKLIRGLESRGVLFTPYDQEGVGPCVGSVLEIRELLDDVAKELPPQGSRLLPEVQKMRRATREFCRATQPVASGQTMTPVERSLLRRELFKLRQAMGRSIAEVAVGYGLDVDDDLAAIIPFNNFV